MDSARKNSRFDESEMKTRSVRRGQIVGVKERDQRSGDDLRHERKR